MRDIDKGGIEEWCSQTCRIEGDILEGDNGHGGILHGHVAITHASDNCHIEEGHTDKN